MEKICERTQELIAGDAPLEGRERDHLAACPKCVALREEYRSLALRVADVSHAEVPAGFADAVMARIEALETPGPRSRFWERILNAPQAQYVALGVGGAVSLVNLARFVFFVLIPVS